MIILAQAIKGKEFIYSRNKAIEIPRSWNSEKVSELITNLNTFFNLPDDKTYHRYEIDQYDLIFPVYKAYTKKGNVYLKHI